MTSFPGIIDLGSRDDLTTGVSPDILASSGFPASDHGTGTSRPAKPASALRSRIAQAPDRSEGRSVSFDIPRPPVSVRSTETTVNNSSKPFLRKRSFELRPAILNKRTERTESNSSHSFLSTSRLWGRSTTKLPSITQLDEHSPVDPPSTRFRIDGLPPFSFDTFDPRFLQLNEGSREGGERPAETQPAAGLNRAVAVSPPILTLQMPNEAARVSLHANSKTTTPPTYEQVGNSLLGQTDAPSQGQIHRPSISSRLSSLPPSIFQISAESGSARLSPSVITRHPPLPMTILPRLLVPEMRESVSPLKPRVGLRSVPALARQGIDTQELENEVGTDDEEEFLEADQELDTPMNQDSEDEDDTTVDGSINRAGTNSDINRSSNSSSITADNDPRLTPATRPIADLLSQKSPQPQSSIQATPIDWDTKLIALISASGPSRSDLAMNRRASRSTGDLLVTKRDIPLIPEARKDKGKAKATTTVDLQGREPTLLDAESRPSLLRRRRSLPTFTESTDPPPYPEFGKTRQVFAVQPREEEGKEKLPPYTNAIYLSALLPRKVEFSAPGVQSKDRKWRRSLCVLEGTAFKIFHPPQGAAGVSMLGQWWERRVGVGDVATGAPPPSNSKQPHRPRKDEEPPEEPNPSPVVAPPESSSASVTKKKRQIASGFLSRSNVVVATSPRRQSIDVLREERGTTRPGRRSLSISRPSLQINNTSSASSTSFTTASGSSRAHGTTISPVASSRSSLAPSSSDRRIITPNPKDLIRVYTLQRAESGLANDYTKRKNVIRVRMEGEQFLLQAPDVSTVVEWVEGFQAASGVALDLEDRPMPKGPVFPRRRRRRIRPAAEAPVIFAPPS